MFGSDEIIRVVIKTDGIFMPRNYSVVEEMSGAVEKIPGVRRVISLPVIKKGIELSGKWDLQKFKEMIQPVTLFKKNLISDDQKTTILTVVLAIDADQERVIHDIQALINNTTKPIAAYQIGMPLVSQAMVRFSEADFKRLPPITLLLVAVLLWSLFRNISFTIVVLGTVVSALIWTIGLTSLLVNRILAIHEFALLSCFGLFSLLIILLTAFPAALMLMPKPKLRSAQPTNTRDGFDQLLDHIVRLNLKHRKIILISIGVLVVLGIAGMYFIRVETNPIGFFKAHTSISRHFHDIYQDLSGSFPINVIMDGGDAIHQKREAIGETHPEQIKISTCRRHDHVVVTVSDTGIGIPEEVKEKIFEPFFTTKEVGKGMGLGLSIIYGIVKEYGGEIEMHSSPGLGALFKHSFPIADTQAALE